MPPRVSDIQHAVCEHFGVSALDMISHRRGERIARARQVAMFLTRYMTAHSLPAIGRMFGNRDHSTVIHAVRRVHKLCEELTEIRDAVHGIRAALEQRVDERVEAALAYWGA